MEFLGASFTSWFTLRRQLADAFMIRTTKLEPEREQSRRETGRGKKREKTAPAAAKARITPARYLSSYSYAEPINLCFKKMNVVIVIVPIMDIYRARGTRQPTVP